MNLFSQFEAAFDEAAPPVTTDTPLQRIPPKNAPAIVRNTARARINDRENVPSMRRVHLMDVTRTTNLGAVVKTRKLPNGAVRLKTTLTTLDVVGDRIVRGRIHKKGLHGVQVLYVDPMAL